MHFFQHTLSRQVSCTGIGLHSGKRVNLTLHPAEPDTGVMFKRSDLPGAQLIPGDVYHVVDTNFCTTVGLDGIYISTVEHLMSALAGLSIDNLLVEVDSPELPIMDGSAGSFVMLLREVGLTTQARPRQFYRAKREISITQGDKYVRILPTESLSVDFSIDFPHPAIGTQRYNFIMNEKNYDREISRSRTFGFLADMRKLHEMGLGLGGSLENAVVLDKYRVLNEGGLRYPDEFVRHKVLDLLGDLALVGRPVLGHFEAHRSGHGLNNQLFRKFLDDPQAWQLVTPTLEESSPAMPSPRPEVAPLFKQAVA